MGITNPSHVEPELVNLGTYPGVRLDATQAIGPARSDEAMAKFCGRLFVLFGHRAALILDRIDLHHNGRVESRLHTRANVQTAGDQALLTGERQKLTLAFAANLPFTLTTASTVPTTPGDEATVLRWCGPRGREERFWMATLLVPGQTTAAIDLEPTPDGIHIRLQVGDWSQTLTLTSDLLGPAVGGESEQMSADLGPKMSDPPREGSRGEREERVEINESPRAPFESWDYSDRTTHLAPPT